MSNDKLRVVQTTSTSYNENLIGCGREALIINTSDGGIFLGNSNATPQNIATAPIINILYSNLVELRDNSQLVPGQQYRITDYVTTTVQENTRSAGHQFDIIVTADTENVLNEVARACLHDGDTYFANCDLAAWELKYRLDNDVIFAWADIDNGKGVIYYMKDEHNNECAYDFKNIQYIKTILNGQLNEDNGEDTWVYTFNAYNQDDETHYDATVIANQITIDDSCNQCYGNIIKEYVNDCANNYGTPVLYYLNNNVFLNLYSSDTYFICYGNSFGNDCTGNSFGNDCHDNSFENGCNDNSFGNGCSYNTFENGCSYNTFGNSCYSNSFGNDCTSNSFGNSCYSNSFGNGCSYNSFGNGCSYNTFGNDCTSNSFGNNCIRNSFGNNCFGNSFGSYCYDNSFGSYCYDNSFENGCYYNSFGSYCYDNSFGNDCYDNSFGNSCCGNSFGNDCYDNSFENGCYYNSFGNECFGNSFGSYCYSNSFGSYCYSNSFGNSCYSNSFGNECSYNTFGNECSYNTFGNGCSYNSLTTYTETSHFDDGCSYIVLWSDQTLSLSYRIKNINVNRGVCGANSSNKVLIYIDDLLNSETEINVDNVNGYTYILKENENIYKTTYDNLVSLRNNYQLIPGLQYRIIDYVTTTMQENSHSIGNQFDIIVTAIDEETLSEDAKAIHNADNDYFNDCNLSAWELKYCLDNDINRFAWSTYINLVNSSDISIKSELVNDNCEFNTPFKPTAYMHVDTSQDYADGEHGKDEDYIYEYGYESNPDDVDNQLCLFKSEIEIYPEEGTDYMDKFFYAGTHDVDGVTYDKWRKAEIDCDGNHVWAQSYNGPGSGIYILTEQITTDGAIETKAPGGNGKGVIYYMKDEYGNECPYDFKSIQFKRYKITSFTQPDIVNSSTLPIQYAQNPAQGYGYEVDMDDYIYCYTFASNQTDDNEDLSVTQECECKSNIIKAHVFDNSNKINLNNNVFFYDAEFADKKIKHNYFAEGSHDNTFCSLFANNTMSNYFRYNIIGAGLSNKFGSYNEYNIMCNVSSYNTFDDVCDHNIIGYHCAGNIFGDATKLNIIGADCETNDFGMVFQNNVISTGFYRNRFTNNTAQNNFGTNFKFNNCAAYFMGNTFVDNTMNNMFGCSFRTNKFGSKVGINTFGEQCINNTFGSNIVGNTCHSNTRNNIVGANFTHNIGKFAYSTFGINVHTDVENGSFITACDFGNSSYFNLQVPTTASTENYVKNLKFCNVNGTASVYVNITPPTTNQDYELKVAKNSNGELKIYCDADEMTEWEFLF